MCRYNWLNRHLLHYSSAPAAVGHLRHLSGQLYSSMDVVEAETEVDKEWHIVGDMSADLAALWGIYEVHPTLFDIDQRGSLGEALK